MNAEHGSESLRPYETKEKDEQDADGSTPAKETKGAEENAVAVLELGKAAPQQGQGRGLDKHGVQEISVKDSQSDKPQSSVDPKGTREATGPLIRSGVRGDSEVMDAGKSGREQKQETSVFKGMTAGANRSDTLQTGEKAESGHDASKTKGSEKQETPVLKGMTAGANRSDTLQAGEKVKPGHDAGKIKGAEKQETSVFKGMTAGAKGNDILQAGEKAEPGHDAGKTKGSENQGASALKEMTAGAKRSEKSQAGEKVKPGHDAGKIKGSEKQETSALKGMTANAERSDTPRAQGGVRPKPSESRIRGETVKQADQVPDKAGAKVSGEEKREAVLARIGSSRDAVAASAADKERPARHTEDASKRGGFPKDAPLKSEASDVKSTRSAYEGRDPNSSRQEGRGSESGEQRDTAMQGKRENEASSVRLANNTPNRGGEPGFDRSMQKSDMNIQDNPTANSTDSSSSPKAVASNAHPGETAMVKRSFQESGVKHFVDKASLNLKNGQQEFKIELKPESLGQVRVQVSTDNHQVTIRIVTELPVAKEMIENNIHQLKAELQGQGLQIDKFDVSLSQNSNKNGEANRFFDSRKAKKDGGERKPSGEADAANDAKGNGWTQHQASAAGAINLFA